MGETDLLFPYMFWAHTESFRSPYCLAQSALPVPEGSWLGGLRRDEVLGHPSADALPRLEARLAELFDVPAERVVVTLGATGAMHLAALLWFRPRCRVVHEVPSYQPLRVLPGLFGAEPRPIERRLADGWAVAPEDVGRELGPGPGHLFLTNPHNPSGAVLDERTVRDLAETAARAGGVLVSCEVYMEFAKNEERVHAAKLAPNAVSIGSLTKAYGLGGLRIGWILLGEGLADRREALIDRGYLAWIDPPTAALAAANRALEHLPTLLQPLRRVEAESRPHLVRWLTETEGIEATVPPFGILSFPRIHGVDDTRALAAALAEHWDVDVVPGEFFGAPGHLRVACGVPAATLVEGLSRLSNGIRVFKERM